MSRITKALDKLRVKCTEEGAHPNGKDTADILECIAEHYAGGGGGGALVVHMTGEYELIEQGDVKGLYVRNGHIDRTIEEILAADDVIFIYNPTVDISGFVITAKYFLKTVFTAEYEGGVQISAASYVTGDTPWATISITATEDGVDAGGSFRIDL